MKEVLLSIVRYLVEHPDDVDIQERMDGDATILIIKTNPSDIGKIIGKNGRIIKALRDIMKILAFKQSTYVDVEIMEEE